jgi:hypothetical protein
VKILDNQNFVPAVALVRVTTEQLLDRAEPKFFALFAVNSLSFVLFVSFVVTI